VKGDDGHGADQRADDEPTLVADQATAVDPASMALPDLGAKFEVLRPIGRGGMGAVYQVRHRKLDHVRAVKVLTSVSDPVALERLRREASIATELAHPNIVTVYDLEELADGSLAIVMEYLEGSDLAGYSRVHGRMGTDELVNRFAGVADALDRMHAAGVIHRDLKPANLFVCDSGVIKVLDFGISRVVTEETRLTQTGSAVGTPAFMAPEQFEGRDVTPAADIYALGSVLYACLTGETPVKGASQAELIANVLFQAPPSADVVCHDVSRTTAQALDRALSKDPAQRFESASALLRGIGGGGAAAPTADTTLFVDVNRLATPREDVRGASRSWRRWGIVVAAAGLTLCLTAGWWWAGHRDAGPQGLETLPEPVITQLTFDAGSQQHPTLSPDGQEVVYSDGTDLYLRRVGGRGSINLTAELELPAREPDWSASGDEIAFVAGEALHVMGALGERVREVAPGAYWPNWSPDGREIAYTTSDPAPGYVLTRYDSDLRIVDARTGESRDLVTGRTALMPDWSPDGERIVFSDHYPEFRGTWTVRVDGTELQRIYEHLLVTPRWSRDGGVIYGLVAVGDAAVVTRIVIDPADGSAVGEEETVLRVPAAEAWHLALAAEAEIWAFSSAQRSINLHSVTLEPGEDLAAGPLRPITSGSQRFTSPDISPDGSRVVFVSGGREQDLYVAAVDGSEVRPLSAGETKTRAPRWSRAGDALLFSGDRDDIQGVYTVQPNGSGLRRLSGASNRYMFPLWSPDGSRVAVTDGTPRPLVIDLAGDWDAQLQPPDDPDAVGWFATSWSPDGRWIALSNAERIARMDPETGAIEVLLDHGYWPVWMSDSRRLLIGEGDRVFVYDTESGVTSDVLSLAPGQVSRLPPLSLSADDRTAVIAVDLEDVDIWTVDFTGDAGPTPGPATSPDR